LDLKLEGRRSAANFLNNPTEEENLTRPRPYNIW